MGKTSSSSFRRILFTRILLLTIPILLIGQYMVYQQARSGVLTTARYNLMESAAREADELQALIAMMRSNLLIASQVQTPPSTSPEAAQPFVELVKAWLPDQVQCVQWMTATGQLAGSTCGTVAIAPEVRQRFSQSRPHARPQRSEVLISPARARASINAAAPPHDQLRLVFSAPIYNAQGQLVAILNAQASLQRQVFGSYLSRQGYTVVINEDGVILAHPRTDRIGRTVDQSSIPPILEKVVSSAIAGDRDSLHLFEENREEWLAGYTAVPVPVMGDQPQPWVILAIAPIANALQETRGLQNVLILLTLGLVSAAGLATLFMTRDLAKPLEQLGRYALQIRDRAIDPHSPKNFKVRELNQLAEALDTMIQRLDERADELETAWREAQVANQLKSEFLATTSHELRTPLNAIIGSIRLIKDGCCDSPEEVMEFLQQADDAAIHLLKIINDLLDISKIEVGQIELNLQSVDVNALCQKCLQWVRPMAERKRLQVTAIVEPGLANMMLDERRVRQMVINLLSNAVKFTPAGGFVKLSARQGYGAQLEQENRPDRSPITPTTPYLCLEVCDSGIGIAREHWHLLFRPFQQIDASSTRNYEGTGLGLALTKRLVELLGGTLSFESAIGQGSAFRIWLPMSESAGESSITTVKAT